MGCAAERLRAASPIKTKADLRRISRTLQDIRSYGIDKRVGLDRFCNEPLFRSIHIIIDMSIAAVIVVEAEGSACIWVDKPVVVYGYVIACHAADTDGVVVVDVKRIVMDVQVVAGHEDIVRRTALRRFWTVVRAAVHVEGVTDGVAVHNVVASFITCAFGAGRGDGMPVVVENVGFN